MQLVTAWTNIWGRLTAQGESGILLHSPGAEDLSPPCVVTCTCSGPSPCPLGSGARSCTSTGKRMSAHRATPLSGSADCVEPDAPGGSASQTPAAFCSAGTIFVSGFRSLPSRPSRSDAWATAASRLLQGVQLSNMLPPEGRGARLRGNSTHELTILSRISHEALPSLQPSRHLSRTAPPLRPPNPDCNGERTLPTPCDLPLAAPPPPAHSPARPF